MTTDITGDPTDGRDDGPIIPYSPAPVAPVTGNYTPARVFRDAYSPPAVRQETISGIGTILPLVLGTDRVGAKISAAIDYNGNLVLRCEWAQGPCDGTNGITGPNGAFPGSVSWTHYYGTQVTPDPTLVAAYAAKGVTYTDTLNGICYSVGVFPPGSTDGFPRPINELRGLKVPVTSGGAATYTDNALWYTAWVIESVLGETAGWASFNTANAAACDVLVGGEKKRRIGLTIDREMSVDSLLQLLCGYAGVWLNYDNGTYVVTADAVGSSVRSLTDADFRDGEINVRSRNVKKAPNKIRIKYTDRSRDPWREGEATATTGAGDIVSEVPMPGIFRLSEATRTAIERLNEFRLSPIDIDFVTKDDGLILNRGDIISITSNIGLTAALFRVTSVTMAEEGRWMIYASSYSAAKYSSVVVSDPTGTDPGISSPLNPPSVGAITLTEQFVDGIATAPIRVDFAAVSYLYLVDYRITITRDDGVVVVDTTTPTNSFTSVPLPILTNYTVAVRARSSLAQGAVTSGSISLLGSGTKALASVYSAAIPKAGWSFFGSGTHNTYGFMALLPESFDLYPGDPVFRVRFALTPNSNVVWPGSDQLSPGLGSELLDAGLMGGFQRFGMNVPAAFSPVFDMGANRLAAIAILNIGYWLSLYNGCMDYQVGQSNDGISFGYIKNTSGTAIAQILSSNVRYVRFEFSGRMKTATGTDYQQMPGPPSVYLKYWAVQFDTATLEALMPTEKEVINVTTSASGGLVVQTTKRYITITSIQITPNSSSFASSGYSNVNVSETDLLSNNFQVRAFDTTGTLIAVPVSIEVTGVPAP